MVALVFWTPCTRSGCMCCHLYCCEDFTIHGRWHGLITATSGIMWLLCEHDINASNVWVFISHFVNLFSITMPMSCWDVHFVVPMSHFLFRSVVYARRLWIIGCWSIIYSKCHTGTHGCLQNVQHTYRPSPMESLLRSGSAVLKDKNDPACFPNLQK